MYRFTFSMLIWISFSSSSWMLLCSFKLPYLSKKEQVVQDLMHVRKFWEHQHAPSHCQIGNPSKGTMTDAKNNPPMKHHSKQEDCELRTRQPGSQCSLRTLAEWLEPRSWKGGTLLGKLSETTSPPGRQVFKKLPCLREFEVQCKISSPWWNVQHVQPRCEYMHHSRRPIDDSWNIEGHLSSV